MTLPVVAAMTPADLDAIMLLERQCFTDPWTRHMYLTDLTQNEMATYLTLRVVLADTTARTASSEWQAAEYGWQTAHGPEAPSAGGARPAALSQRASTIVAYGGFWLMMDQAHIATIASHPDWRGCGLGQQLMLALLDVAIARGASTSTLEVRANNQPAQQLYLKLGYQFVGRRRRYYRDGEDGLIMTTPPLSDPAIQARLDVARAETSERLKKCFA